MLKSFEVPHDRVIHILVDEDAEHDLKPARAFMALLARNGYSRSVLVSKKKTESHVNSAKDGRGRGGMSTPPPSSGRRQQPQPARRQIRYKGAND